MVYWMNVSLDLFIEGEPGEEGDGTWMRISESLHREFNSRSRNLSAMVHGRVVYEIMERAWPGIADDEAMPDYMQEYGQIWLDTPKYLVSRSRNSADFNTRVIGGSDAVEQLAGLRADTAGEIGVGGATLATQLMSAGLLDEILLFTHPVVLGTGRPLFDHLSWPIQCELLEQAAFDGGVTMHRYAVAPV
jgi:dihydrofolate reductase